MISEFLLSRSRCPVCIERGPAAARGYEECRSVRDALGDPLRPDHARCRAHYETLWRCPDGLLAKRKLELEERGLSCPCCGQVYALHRDGGYVDLRPPPGTFSELTHYAEEEMHPFRAGPLRPPFLSARIKIDVMGRMLRLSPGDRVLDVGCGNGRAVFFKRPSCAQLVGIDAGAHFAPEAAATVDLARGDIRRLPFAAGSFDKAYSLDVLEHLPEEGVRAVLSETRRVLRPRGLFFIYSHVMMSSRLAVFQRRVNELVGWLDRRGWVDNEPERHRKSDHVNPLTSYELLEKLVADAGFRVVRIRYYNVFAKAVIEDLVLPLAEHNLFAPRRVKRGSPPSGDPEPVPASAERPDVGRWAHGPLALATWLMKLDVAFFGRVRTGPFFLLLRAA